MKTFQMIRDISGQNGYVIEFSDNNYQVELMANTEATLTVPANSNSTYKNWVLIFSIEPGDSVWISKNATATLPGVNFQTCAAEHNPQARYVKPGDIIHCISSADNVQLGVSFYAIY